MRADIQLEVEQMTAKKRYEVKTETIVYTTHVLELTDQEAADHQRIQGIINGRDPVRPDHIEADVITDVELLN